MVELEYYKAKAKMLEFQSKHFQLREEMSNLTRERNDFFRSMGLDPQKNYRFDDSKLEFTEIVPQS